MQCCYGRPMSGMDSACFAAVSLSAPELIHQTMQKKTKLKTARYVLYLPIFFVFVFVSLTFTAKIAATHQIGGKKNLIQNQDLDHR